jgi:hypothetical protein
MPEMPSSRWRKLQTEVEALTKRLDAALTAQQTHFDEAERQRAEAAQEGGKHVEVMFTVSDGKLQVGSRASCLGLEHA